MRASFAFISFALLLLSSTCFADTLQIEQLYGFAGNWESTGTMNIPSWASDGTCTTSDSKYNYAWFNITFPTDGVYRCSSFEDFYTVAVYAGGFLPSNPCTGSGMILADDGYNEEYYFDSYQWYSGGISYTFVLISDDSQGSFTGKITNGYQGATTNTTNQTWNPIYIDSNGECVNEDQGDYAPYYSSLWLNTTTTGWYDLEAAFSKHSDGTYPSYTYLSLFKGSPNGTLTTNGCSAVGDGVELVAATYETYQYAEMIAIRLVAGVQYTVIVSTYTNSFWGPFQFRAIPSRRFNFTNPVYTTTGSALGGFSEPDRSSSHWGSNCQSNDGDYDNRPFAAVAFSVPSGLNWTLRTTEPDNDYAFFTYIGNNTDPATACPVTGTYIDYHDSGSSQVYGPYSATTFTVVATPYYSSDDDDDDSSDYTDVYVVYGTPITSGGNTPTSTTNNVVSTTGNVVSTTSKSSTTGGVSTTSKSSTTTVVTTGSTTTKVTTGSTTIKVTTGGTTIKVTTTSSANTLNAQVVSVAVCIAFLLALFM